MFGAIRFDCDARFAFRLEAAHAFRLTVAGELADVDAIADAIRLDVVGRASGRDLGFPSLDNRHHVADFPELVGHASGHRGSDLQGLMDAHEVVEHLVQCDRVDGAKGDWVHLR